MNGADNFKRSFILKSIVPLLQLQLVAASSCVPVFAASTPALKNEGMPAACGDEALARELRARHFSPSVVVANASSARSNSLAGTTGGAELQGASVTANGASDQVMAALPVTTNSGTAGFVGASSTLEGKPIVSVTLPSTQVGAIDKAIDKDAPLVIDNDEPVQENETIGYQELKTDEAGTKAIVGAQFPVVLCSEVNSKTAEKGDSIEARLKYDLKIGDRVIAKKGSMISGHVSDVVHARTPMRSLVSGKRWYRSSGVLSINFEELVNERGEHFSLQARPAQKALIVKNAADGRELGVNHNGQVVGPWAQQLRWKAARIGLDVGVTAAAGPFALAVMPAAMGIVGAINPSMVFMRPIGTNMRHRRLIGFAWGAIGGLPGAWAVEDSLIKGQEAVLKPGDEFVAEFRQEFAGVPQTDASLIPGSSTKVHGEVIPEKKD